MSKKLMWNLRWDTNGPLGNNISLENAVKLSGLTPEQIQEVLDDDTKRRFRRFTTRQGILFLRARRKRGRTDQRRSKPRVEAILEETECPICYEDLTKHEVVTLLCKHKCCMPCAQEITFCSLCRKVRPVSTLLAPKIFPLEEDYTSDDDYSFEVENSYDNVNEVRRHSLTLQNNNECFRCDVKIGVGGIAGIVGCIGSSTWSSTIARLVSTRNETLYEFWVVGFPMYLRCVSR